MSFLETMKAILQREAAIPVPGSEFSRPTPLTMDAPVPSRAPTCPLRPGWLVTWRDSTGRLRGGSEDPAHGTIRDGQLTETGWRFTLTDGTTLSAAVIVSVAKTGAEGHPLAAWTVRPHGLAGERALDWLQAWKMLAALTNGIMTEEPRFRSVMAALAQCDAAFTRGDWPAFQEAIEAVRRAVEEGAS